MGDQSRSPEDWAKVSFFLFIAQVVIVFVQIFLFTPALNSEIVNQAGTDPIGVAAQIGRLDIVSLVLALLAIILTLSGAVGYLSLRRYTRRVTTSVAEQVTQKIFDQKAEWLIQKVKAELRSEPYDLDDIDTASSEKLESDGNV